MTRTRVCLSIAGSDSGGGAGIQADLKAFARCGVHGATAITALTAQNTVGVQRVEAVSPAMIVAQIESVAQDIGIDAVKVGMLGEARTIEVVAQAITEFAPDAPVVVDPVMVAESGGRLLEAGAEDALRRILLPIATVVTPNLPEARVLAGRSELDGAELARAVQALGTGGVVITGGHREQAIDVVFDGEEITEIGGDRFPDGAAHGSGCTHASVVTAQLALGADLVTAATIARSIAGEAVRDGLRDIGSGPGPVNVLGLGVQEPI